MGKKLGGRHLNTAELARLFDGNAEWFGFKLQKLMENAGKGIAAEVQKRFGKGKNIAVFCGLGNNGGDGFVAARHLGRQNKVRVFLAGKKSEIKKKEAKKALASMEKAGLKAEEILGKRDLKKIWGKFDLVIDALLGVKAEGKLKEPMNLIVEKMNKMKCKKIAVDLETGSLKADLVLSLMVKKAEKANVVSIGVQEKYLHYVGPAHLKTLAKRKPESHKGQNGKVLVLSGSKEYHGATIYCSSAASKLVDLVYVCTEPENIPAVKKWNLEAIVRKFEEAEKLARECDSILIGPGLAKNREMEELCNALLKKFSGKKFVLDATAFDLAEKKNLGKNCCLTPHAGEFKRFLGKKASEGNLKKESKRFGGVIVLKGKVDKIACNGELFYNFTGNALMTAGGTGDLLAGIIAGFAAKNELCKAALAGTFLNGFNGDLLAKKSAAFNSMDLLQNLGVALKKALEL